DVHVTAVAAAALVLLVIVILLLTAVAADVLTMPAHQRAGPPQTKSKRLKEIFTMHVDPPTANHEPWGADAT
ncbi:MAG TPA: hypothetical protein VJY65_05290, partial [Chloroflexota bacterium]|nr:hypothetical protein [Chloroflexota bacterium]